MADAISAGQSQDTQTADQIFPVLLADEPTFPYMIRPRLYEAYSYIGNLALLQVGDYVTIKFTKPYVLDAGVGEQLPFAVLVGGPVANFPNNITARMLDAGNGPEHQMLQFNSEGVVFPVNREGFINDNPRPLVSNNWEGFHPALLTATSADIFNFRYTLTQKDGNLNGTHNIEVTQWLEGDEGNVYTTNLGYLGMPDPADFHWIDPTVVIGNPRAFFNPFYDNGPEPEVTCASQATIISVTFNIQS